ncbi:MAG: sugar kinase [Abitibacteriaceae bacterium]|nr:sugar kinase [Abditibacteriaceae bacterium]
MRVQRPERRRSTQQQRRERRRNSLPSTAPCDVVTIGETMVLLQPLTESALPYAPLFTRSIAGAESNLAIALARIGKKVRWISRLGHDPFGDIIVSTLAGEGIDTSFVVRDETAPTAVFFRELKAFGDPHVYYYRRDSAASRLTADEVRPEWLAGARLLHVTGITPALGVHTLEAITYAMQLAREQGLIVSFDPNLRRKLWDEATARRALLSLVPLCDIFLPGIEEAEFLLGPQPPEDYGAAFLAMGPCVVALKTGKDGALGFVKRHSDTFVEQYSLHAPPYPVSQIVDPIGAGDAFAAGFLSVWLDQPPATNRELALSRDVLEKALTRANLLGALATQSRGDWENLPHLAELEHLEQGKQDVTR